MGIKNFGKFISTKYPACVKSFSLHFTHRLAIDLTLFIHRFYHTDATQTIDSIAERILAFDKRLVCSQKYYVIDGTHDMAKKHAHDRRKSAMDSSLEKSSLLETKLQLIQAEIDTFSSSSSSSSSSPESVFLYEYYKSLVDAKLKMEAEMDLYDTRGMGIDKKTMQEIIKKLSTSLIIIQSDCGEAEKYCSKLMKENKVDFVVTEDLDTLCFGSTNVVRGITSATPTIIFLQDILTAMNLTYHEFVDFCILSGSDFTISPKGFGPATALKEFLKSGKKLELVNYKSKKWTEDEITLFLDQVKIAREIFIF